MQRINMILKYRRN